MEPPAPPPDHVLSRHGVAAAPLRRLPGGQGTSWRAGDVVLKPLDTPPGALEWQCAVLQHVEADGLRIAFPLRTRDEEAALVADGWTAWPFLPGEINQDWAAIMAAGDRLHAALAGLDRPGFLDERTDGWARADRIAWDEEACLDPAPEIAALLAARRSLDLPFQLIHGDLSGNVLIDPAHPPAIIDFSAYWRPAAYGRALVAVDAALWFDRPPDDVEPQLLIRALLFRLLSARHREDSLRRARPLIAAHV